MDNSIIFFMICSNTAFERINLISTLISNLAYPSSLTIIDIFPIHLKITLWHTMGFPCGSASKESTGNVGDLGSILWLGWSLGGRKGYPLQYFVLENLISCIVHGVTKNSTELSDFHFRDILCLEKAMASHSGTLAWKNPMDRGACWAAVHGVAESRTRLRDFTFTFHFHALEKEMTTHSSVLAWRMSGTEEPGGLPSMGSHRVRHDWSDLAEASYTYMHCPLLNY